MRLGRTQPVLGCAQLVVGILRPWGRWARVRSSGPSLPVCLLVGAIHRVQKCLPLVAARGRRGSIKSELFELATQGAVHWIVLAKWRAASP